MCVQQNALLCIFNTEQRSATFLMNCKSCFKWNVSLKSYDCFNNCSFPHRYTHCHIWYSEALKQIAAKVDIFTFIHSKTTLWRRKQKTNSVTNNAITIWQRNWPGNLTKRWSYYSPTPQKSMIFLCFLFTKKYISSYCL